MFYDVQHQFSNVSITSEWQSAINTATLTLILLAYLKTINFARDFQPSKYRVYSRTQPTLTVAGPTASRR